MNSDKNHPFFDAVRIADQEVVSTKEQLVDDCYVKMLDRTIDGIYNSWFLDSRAWSINTAVDAAVIVPSNPVVFWSNATVRGSKYCWSLDRAISEAEKKFGKGSTIVGKDSLGTKNSVGIYIPLDIWLKWNLAENEYRGNEEQQKTLAMNFIRGKLYDRTTIGEITWFSEQEGLKPEKAKVKVFCEPKMLCSGDLK